MKSRYKKIMALGLCAVFASLSAVAGLHANGSLEAKATEINQETDSEETGVDETEDTNDEDSTSDNGMIYVIADADGNTREVILSNLVKESVEEDSDSSYKMDQNDIKVLDTDDNEIAYSKDIEEEIPVDLAVSYTLDGQSISADELAGKSGHVTIRYDYTPLKYETVTIDGKKEEMAVPFMMLTGMILDDDNFTNVEVSNGKVIDDGSRTIAVGFALPGMSDDLNLDSDTLELPEYVEISADVTDFEMSNVVTMASNEIFNEVDEDKLDDVDELSDAMEALTDGMDKLLDGSSALYDGVGTLLDKSDLLIDGVDKLTGGSKELSEGAKTLANGADDLADGAAKVDAGASDLKKGASKLSDGADSLNAGIKEAYEGAGDLADGAAQLDSGLSQLSGNSQALNAGAKQVFDSLLSAASSQLAQAGITITLTADNYSDTLSYLISQVGESSQEGQTLASLKSQLDAYNTFYQGLLSYTDGVDSAADGASSVSSGAAGLEGGLSKIYSGSDTLKDGVDALYKGTKSLKSGTSQLSDGADKLSEGAKTLSKGSKKLYSGILKMDESTPALKKGIEKLYDGAMQLDEGLQKYNDEGIEKLDDEVSGNLVDVITRVRAMIDISQSYSAFSLGDDTSLSFIYETDAIETEE